MKYILTLLAILLPTLVQAQGWPAVNSPIQAGRTAIGLTVFNPVTDHNAPIDGITDAAAAINASLADCAAAGGGQVVLPMYQYVVSSADINISSRKCTLRFASAQSWAANGVDDMAAPALLLNSARTVKVCGALRDFAIHQYGVTLPTNVQDTAVQIAKFAGVAITPTCHGAIIETGMIIGFNICINNLAIADTRVDNLAVHCKTFLRLDNVHDVAHISRIHGWWWLTGANAAKHSETQTISAAGNNGSGLYRLTVADTSKLLTGNQVVVSGIKGVEGANGKWIITVVDATHIDLQSSSFAGVTKNGTWASGETVVNLPDMIGVWPGMVVAGANIAASTKIRLIDRSKNVVWLDTPTTGSGSSVPLTFTSSGAFAAGVLGPEIAFRPAGFLGDFIYVTNSEMINYSDIFAFAWPVSYHIGTKAVWQQFVNANDDGFFDPDHISVLLDDNPVFTSFDGGSLGANNISIVDKTIPSGVNTFNNVKFSRTHNYDAPSVVASLQGAGETNISNGIGACTVCGVAAYYGDIVIYAGAGKKKISGDMPQFDIHLQNSGLLTSSLTLAPSTILAPTSPFGYKEGTWTPQLAFNGNSAGFTYLAGGQQGTYTLQWPFYRAEFLVALNGPLPPQTGFPTVIGSPSLGTCSSSVSSAASGVVNAAAMTGLTGSLYWLAGIGTNVIGLRQSASTGTANLSEANFTPTSLLRGTPNCRMEFTQR